MYVYYVSGIPFGNELYHHGIKGQKWGVRRYQNEDGSLTPAGKERYNKENGSDTTDATSEIESHESIKRRSEKLEKQIEKDLTKSDLNEHDRKITARKIALGVGIAASIGVSVYFVAQAGSYSNLLDVDSDIQARMLSGADRSASVIGAAMNKDISSLSDMDEVITANTVLQRVIRDGNDLQQAIDVEKARDFIYATFDDNDNLVYSMIFTGRSEGKKLITNRTALNDLLMPSTRKRASAFTSLLKDDSFLKLVYNECGYDDMLSFDMFKMYSNKLPGNVFDMFNRQIGNANSKSGPIYIKKIMDMGYNAIRDDNDSGYLGSNPIILLNASKDTVLSGYKAVRENGNMMARLKVRKVPKYDKSLIFSGGGNS